MHKLRKICSVVLSVLMIFSIFQFGTTITAFAAGTPTLSTENKTVEAGSEFTVNVNIKNAASVYNGNFTLQYDSSKLEVKSYKYGSIFNEHTRNCNLNYQSTGNQIRFTFSGAYSLTGDGALVTFTFRANENVLGASSLNFTAFKIYDENGISLSPTATNGSVSISEKVSAKPKLSVVGGTVNAGDIISVPVKITNSESVYNGNFTLQYDSSLLTAESYTYGSIFNEHTKNCNLNYQSTGNQIRFTFSGAYSLTGDGTLITFTFRAKENISGTSSLIFTSYKMYDENGISLSPTATNGNITVNEKSSSNIVTGQCGNNAYYELNLDTGLMEITGTGGVSDNWEGNDKWKIARTRVKNIVIKNGINSLSYAAFRDFVILESVIIPNGVTAIGAQAFSYCVSLVNITIPDSVIQIGENAFNRCEALKNIVIPEGVKEIERCTFSDCTSLESITIPSTVTAIDREAFSFCKSLKSVTILDGVTQIGENAFNRCEALKNIVIPEGVKEIERCAFYYCTSLESITIPSTVTAIAGGAFSFCESLKSVIIPDGVTEIGSEAFYVCNSLESIIIPNSVTSFVGDMVFASCPNLTIYGYKNSTAKIYADEHKISFIALDAAELSSISIATQPSKKIYYVGDSLDTNGLQLKLTYSDGSTETASSGFTTSGFDSTTSGTKTVTVKYEGKTTNFTVTVNTPTISLSSTNKTMTIGDTATLTATTTPSGQTVAWVSSNTSVATVSSNGTVTVKAAGTAVITARFTYNGITYSKTCNITVEPESNPEPTLSSISIATKPTKTTYEIGEAMNTSGLTLKLTYSDGSTKTVSSGFTVSSPDMTTVGTKTVTVAYQGKITTFSIMVQTSEPTVYDVAVTLEAPTTLILGKEFTLNVYIEGTYDGYSFEIPKFENFSYISSKAANNSIKIDERTDRLVVSTMPGLELTDSPKTLLVSVTYKVNQNAPVGFMNLSLANAKITNEFGDIITTAYIGKKDVELTNRIPGDINGDNVFDYTDVAKLYAYFRGNTTIDESIDVDFNNDGTFDYTDVAKLYAIFRGKSNF